MSVATSNMKLIGAFLILRYRVHKLFHHIFTIMNLIRALVSQLRETQALACGGGGGGGDGVRIKTIICPKFQISGI